MDKQDNNRLAAVEAILADFGMGMQELRKSQAETDRLIKQSQVTAESEMQKIRNAHAEIAEQIKQSRTEFAEQIKQSQVEFDRKSDALNVQIKAVNEHIGGVSNSNGLFAEEYFFNSFDNGKQTFFGERFDVIMKNLKGAETADEFDVVLLNGQAVGILEVKYKARVNDIPKVLRKVDNFRLNFPRFNNHRIYLGYATLAFDKIIEQECINQGIAVIKQVGDTVVINDKHLKVF